MIEEALTSVLQSAWPGVTVFPSQVPENQKPPYIAYREVDRDDDSVSFEIDAVANSGLSVNGYRASKELAAAIRAALANGFTFDGGCVLRADITKQADHVDVVDPMHWTRAQYSLALNTNPY